MKRVLARGMYKCYVKFQQDVHELQISVVLTVMRMYVLHIRW